MLAGERVFRFEPEQLVYLVKQKRRKVVIIQTRIDFISTTGYIKNPLEYLFRYHTYHNREVYWDDSKNIFDNKDDAYEYAEHLDKRKNIKFKEISY